MRRVWAVAVAALAACQAIVGIEDTTEGTSSPSTGGTGGTEAGVGGSGAKDGSSDAKNDASDASDASPDTGNENCANGFDDDDDGDIDCADSDCVGWKCAPAVPVPFTGPVFYWEGPTGQEPSCAAPFDVELATLFADLACPDATCPCTCGQANGQTCTSTFAIWWSKNGCPINNVSDDLTSGCQTPVVSAPDHVVVLSGGGSKTQGGNCTPSGGAPQKTTAWGVTGRICGASLLQGGCAGGTQCVPSAAEFQGPCIFRTGDVACPLSGYSEKHVVYETTDDTRGCSSCTCGAASGGGCSQNGTTYSDGSCQTQSGTFPIQSNTCEVVSNVGSYKFNPSLTQKGSCPPQVNPTGSCTPKNPTTVCCTPRN